MTGVRGRAVWWMLAALPLTFLAVLLLWPLSTILARGLLADGLDLVGAFEVATAPRSVDALITTIGLAAAGTAGSILLGLPCAWALYRIRWRGQRTVRALATVPFVLPTIVVASAFSALLSRSGPLGFLGLDQSVVAIVAALVFYNTSVAIRVIGGTWAGLDPSTVDAARTLGASDRRAFWHITLPALAPAIGSAAAVVFLFCATAFGVVLVLGGTRVRTLETEIYLQVGQFLDLRAAAVLSILQVLLVGLALALAAWARRRREVAPGARRVDGSRPARRRDLRMAGPALGVMALLVGFPLFALVERSLRTVDGYGFDHYRALMEPPAVTVLPVPVWQAGINSLMAATVAAAVACTLGLVVVHLTGTRSWRASLLDAMVMLPLGVSAVIVGLGMLLTLNRAVLGVDLRGSWWLVPLAQAVVALPLVVRTLSPSARAIDPRLRAAASSLGASPARVWREVDWPLLKRPFGLALGFGFAISLGEFGATTFVARPENPTLPTAIYRLLGRPGADNLGMAFAAAVVLALLTMAVMMSSERLRTQVGAEL